MFKLLIALSVICAIASAGYISGYGLGSHGVSYSVPAYQSTSYVAAVPIVKTYSAPIVSGPVVKTITPLSAHTVKAYKVVETAPAYVHSAPSVYADHGYSEHYGVHYGKKR